MNIRVVRTIATAVVAGMLGCAHESLRVSASPPPSLPKPKTGPLCRQWREAERIGALDKKRIDEASGIEAYGDLLFHINDGNVPAVFVTDRRGQRNQRIEIQDFQPRDLEDIAIGPCGAGVRCLFLADIGDNLERRSSVQVAAVDVEALRSGSPAVKPRMVLELRYPDRSHNAEAFGVTPEGDLIIVTKEMTSRKVARVAHVFRLAAGHVGTSKEPRTLQPWGSIDVPALVGSTSFEGLVTAMDVAESGNRVMLLTYDTAIELAWTPSQEPLALPPLDSSAVGDKVQRIPIRRLNQQEALGYDENQYDFIYNTEAENLKGGADVEVELVRVRCLDER